MHYAWDFLIAEAVRFELTIPFEYAGFRNQCNKPLCDASRIESTTFCFFCKKCYSICVVYLAPSSNG